MPAQNWPASHTHRGWMMRVDARNDFETLAAQIAALDRVVTVSNVTAHPGRRAGRAHHGVAAEALSGAVALGLPRRGNHLVRRSALAAQPAGSKVGGCRPTPRGRFARTGRRATFAGPDSRRGAVTPDENRLQALPPLSVEALAQYNAGLRRSLQEKNLPAALRHFQAPCSRRANTRWCSTGWPALPKPVVTLRRRCVLSSVLRQRMPSARVDEWLARLHYRRQQYRDCVPLFAAVLEKDPARTDIVPTLPAQFRRGNVRRFRACARCCAKTHWRTRACRRGSVADLAAMYMRHADYARLDACLPDWLARYPQDAGLAGTAAVWYLGAGDYPRGLALLRQRQDRNSAYGHARMPACVQRRRGTGEALSTAPCW
jgi:hypothetical protein